jgi:hypothetical protein
MGEALGGADANFDYEGLAPDEQRIEAAAAEQPIPRDLRGQPAEVIAAAIDASAVLNPVVPRENWFGRSE